MPVTDHPFRPARLNGPLRPLLHTTFLHPTNGRHQSAWALIDTGADTCVLPIDFIIVLGLNPDDGEAIPIMTANGISESYKHAVKIEITGHTVGEKIVCFSPNLHQPLLGVESFLKEFRLTIDYPKQVFSLNFSEPADPHDNPHSWTPP